MPLQHGEVHGVTVGNRHRLGLFNTASHHDSARTLRRAPPALVSASCCSCSSAHGATAACKACRSSAAAAATRRCRHYCLLAVLQLSPSPAEFL